MSLSRSVTPPEASQSGVPVAADSPLLVAGANGLSVESGTVDERVLFEGYLYKVPPLKKSLLMVVSTAIVLPYRRLHNDILVIQTQ